MDKDKIAKRLSDMLPERPSSVSLEKDTKKDSVDKAATDMKIKHDAKELARIKLSEKRKLETLEKRKAEREAAARELGLDKIPDGLTIGEARKMAEHEERIRAIERIEQESAQPLDLTPLANGQTTHGYSRNTIKDMLKLQGTSRPEIAKLLTSLNINLSIQLTKQDTANLLACLLTCNESQLTALMSNKKVPVVIKTIIKRLIEDMKLGNIDTVEKLWDRVFGKGAMQLNLPEQQQLQTGIIPNVPVSREAYLIIRDTLIK